MLKRILVLVLLMVLLTACDVPTKNTSQGTCEPTLPTTIAETTIPSLVDPIIEGFSSTTRAGLWEGVMRDDSVKMGSNDYLYSLLTDDYLDETVVMVYKAEYCNFFNFHGDSTGERVDISAHLGCACKSPEDVRLNEDYLHATLYISYFYRADGSCQSLLAGEPYEQIDGYANVYKYSRSDGTSIQYLALLSPNYACRFNIDTAYEGHEHIAEELIKYVVNQLLVTDK